jgi:hypothetical protein
VVVKFNESLPGYEAAAMLRRALYPYTGESAAKNGGKVPRPKQPERNINPNYERPVSKITTTVHDEGDITTRLEDAA